jgi:hypothetical protein
LEAAKNGAMERVIMCAPKQMGREVEKTVRFFPSYPCKIGNKENVGEISNFPLQQVLGPFLSSHAVLPKPL